MNILFVTSECAPFSKSGVLADVAFSLPPALQQAGDNVEIYRASVEKEDGLHVYVEGKVEGQSSYCVEIVF